MAKVSYKQRMISLIELNKSDAEIKNTIYKEYDIVVKLSDIEAKRNTNYILEFKENKKQEIDSKVILVKEILNDNYYNPLTKKEIVNKIYANHDVYLTPIEIKEILWTKLRNEIIYDKYEWTYRLKNKINNEFEEIENPTLIQYLKNNISEIIKELFGKIQFSQTVNFSEEFLYNGVNDILEFDIHNELSFEKLQKIVLENYNLLGKVFNIIQNINSVINYRNDIIENGNDIIESDLNNFIDKFQTLFEVDEDIVMIKNKFLFNQTKDELEFLYEAYDKYNSVLDKTNDTIKNDNSFAIKAEILSPNILFDTNEKINKLLIELDNPVNSINLILDLIKNSQIINDNEKVNNYLEKLINEAKKIEFLVYNNYSITNNYEGKNSIENLEKNNSLELVVFSNILKEEKYRLGSPVVNQFVENVTKRIKDLK
jgi:hypothetical protein